MRHGRRRQELPVQIIASKPEAITASIIRERKRGVTALHGRGMYTQQDRDVLLGAATATEMAQLKARVSNADPNAFVVLTPCARGVGPRFPPAA